MGRGVMWQVPVYFISAGVVQLLGAWAARLQAVEASAAGGAWVAGVWWAVAGLGLVYGASSFALACIRGEGEGQVGGAGGEG